MLGSRLGCAALALLAAVAVAAASVAPDENSDLAAALEKVDQKQELFEKKHGEKLKKLNADRDQAEELSGPKERVARLKIKIKTVAEHITPLQQTSSITKELLHQLQARIEAARSQAAHTKGEAYEHLHATLVSAESANQRASSLANRAQTELDSLGAWMRDATSASSGGAPEGPSTSFFPWKKKVDEQPTLESRIKVADESIEAAAETAKEIDSMNKELTNRMTELTGAVQQAQAHSAKETLEARLAELLKLKEGWKNEIKEAQQKLQIATDNVKVAKGTLKEAGMTDEVESSENLINDQLETETDSAEFLAELEELLFDLRNDLADILGREFTNKNPSQIFSARQEQGIDGEPPLGGSAFLQLSHTQNMVHRASDRIGALHKDVATLTARMQEVMTATDAHLKKSRAALRRAKTQPAAQLDSEYYYSASPMVSGLLMFLAVLLLVFVALALLVTYRHQGMKNQFEHAEACRQEQGMKSYGKPLFSSDIPRSPSVTTAGDDGSSSSEEEQSLVGNHV